jgi:hypothetical protein
MGPHQHAHPHKATTAKPVKMSKKKAKKPTTEAPKPTGVVREAAKN